MIRTEILLVSRAYESRPVEGGFVLLKDLAHGLADMRDVHPSFLSVENHGSQNGVDLVGNMWGTEWGMRARLSFVKAVVGHHRSFDVVHTAHVPTPLNASFFRLLTSIGRRANTRFVQTITALPTGPGIPSEHLFWGDHLVCQSQSVYNRLEPTGRPVSTIPPWPSPDRVEFDPKRRRRTRQHRFSRYEAVVVFPGEFDRLGVGYSLRETLIGLMERSDNVCVVLACRYDESGIAHRIRQSLSEEYADRILVTGAIDWIVELLEAADLVIYPARTMEGKFQPPLVLLEALTLGVPVLTSQAVDLPSSADPNLTFEEPAVPRRKFGRRAGRLLEATQAGTAASNRHEETLRSYVGCYRELVA